MIRPAGRTADRFEAMITDPVYEGKSMAAVIDLVGHGEIERSPTVLFAHLGGQPAINGYSALFRGSAAGDQAVLDGAAA